MSKPKKQTKKRKGYKHVDLSETEKKHFKTYHSRVDQDVEEFMSKIDDEDFKKDFINNGYLSEFFEKNYGGPLVYLVMNDDSIEDCKKAKCISSISEKIYRKIGTLLGKKRKELNISCKKGRPKKIKRTRPLESMYFSYLQNEEDFKKNYIENQKKKKQYSEKKNRKKQTLDSFSKDDFFEIKEQK